MPINIIKLGGSLMHSQQLSCWLTAIGQESKTHTIIIVPGGGEFADKVRQLQKDYRFNDAVAHQMALLAMCQYGYWLKGLNPDIGIFTEPEQYQTMPGRNRVFLWLPLEILYNPGKLQQNWDYSSDSIALWLAIKLNAGRLLVVKSDFPPVAEDNITGLVEAGYIDRGFQQLVNSYDGIIQFIEKSRFNQLTNILSAC